MVTAINRQKVILLMVLVSVMGIWCLRCLTQSTGDVVMRPMPLRPIDMLVIQQRGARSPTVAKVALTIRYISGIQKTFSFEALSKESFAFQEPNSPVTKKVDIEHLERLVRKSKDIFAVHLVDGRTFHARLVENSPNFYPERASAIPQQKLVAAPNGEQNEQIEIKLDKVALMQVNWQSIEGNRSPQKTSLSGGPVTFVLKDNESFKTGDGHIVDYCGHWWSTSSHRRLNIVWWSTGSPWRVAVIDDSAKGQGDRRYIDCSLIDEIKLTGDFGKEWSGCRGIVIKFRDGSSQKTNLYLTGESYGGVCYATNACRTDLDCVVGKTDYGSLEIPLDCVSKIVFTKTKKVGEPDAK